MGITSKLAKDNRGVGPMVATIILIAITLVLFVIIFLWIRGMMADQVIKFSEPAQTVCQRVAYKATYSGTGNSIDISNRGNVPIVGFSIEFKIGKKTTVKPRVTPMSNVLSPAAVDVMTIEDKAVDLGNAAKIKVTPIILGKTKKGGKAQPYNCKDKASDIK